MRTQRFDLLVAGLILGLALLLSACKPAGPGEVAPEEGPQAVVESFYRWYLGYPGNPLASRAYQSREELSAELVGEVDATLDGFQLGSGDPFLCAQDVPGDFRVGEANGSGSQAAVVVTMVWNAGTEHESLSEIEVQLQLVEGQWKIHDITCAAPEAVEGQPAQTPAPPEEPTAPALPEAYREVEASPIGLLFEIPHSWQQVETDLAWSPDASSGLRIGVNWVDLEPPMEPEAVMLPNSSQILASEPAELSWGEGRSFTLELYSPAAEGEQASVQAVETHVLIVLQQNENRRGIDLYASAPTADALASIQPILDHAVKSARLTAGESGWPIFRDRDLGVEIQYPPDWTYQEVELLYPELSAPIVGVVQFLPQEWAEELNSGGAPDASAPVIVAPLSLEVSQGTLEEYRRQYPQPAVSEEVTVGDQTVTREEDSSADEHLIRYVFQHPVDESLRVTLVDQISGFSARAQGNETVMAQIGQMISSFQFIR